MAHGSFNIAVLFKFRPQARRAGVSVDDIEHLLEAGRAEGVLEAVEQAVAAEALRLGGERCEISCDRVLTLMLLMPIHLMIKS